VSIIPNRIPDGWVEYKPPINFAWITTLFSSEKHKGKNLGCITMKEVENYLLSKKIYFLLLDCYVNDGEHLVSYYRSMGYKEIIRKEICYPTHTFTAALMSKRLEMKTQKYLRMRWPAPRKMIQEQVRIFVILS
jgi:hypothetical protein